MPKVLAGRNGLFILLPLLLLLGACASSAERSQARLARYTAEGLYEQGQKAVRASDYGQAIRIYEALVARYPFANQARQARLDLIYVYYKSGEKESAIDAADTFIRENPTHPRIDYAWYLKGLIEFERVPHTVERWLRVDLSQRTPQTARDSFISFRTVVERFPKSMYAPDARARMVYLRNRVADHEMQIAHYYESRGAWVAASQRAMLAIEQYDGAPAIKEALRVLIRCYRELNYTELAENTEKVFRENYPDEPLQVGRNSDRWWKFWS